MELQSDESSDSDDGGEGSEEDDGGESSEGGLPELLESSEEDDGGESSEEDDHGAGSASGQSTNTRRTTRPKALHVHVTGFIA